MSNYSVIVRNKNTDQVIASFHGDDLAKVQVKYDHYKASQVDHNLSGLKAEVVKRKIVNYGQGPEWVIVATKGGDVK